MLDISVNLLFIDKLLNADIRISFYKTGYTLIKDDTILIDIYYYNLFFLDL